MSREEFEKIVKESIKTIFKKLIEAVGRNEEEIKEIATVWHEIAHHFGMSEVR